MDHHVPVNNWMDGKVDEESKKIHGILDGSCRIGGCGRDISRIEYQATFVILLKSAGTDLPKTNICFKKQ